MKTFDRRIALILAALAGLLAMVILVGSRAGLPAPLLLAPLAPAAPAGETTYQVGARGALTLSFASSVEPQSFAAHFSLDPPAAGNFQWKEEGRQTVSFRPAEPLKPGQRYRVQLSAGLRGRDGRALQRSLSWTVVVREEAILYLAPSQAPELWIAPPSGQNPVQLSASGGKVYDYGVSRDGETIVFSVQNEQGGIDLWQADRSGSPGRLLLPCGADRCYHPALAPDGRQLVYSRGKASGLPGSGAGAPHLWQLDLVRRKTNALFSDANIGGADAQWSPDGRYLAFLDAAAPALRVLDFEAQQDYQVETGADAAFNWAPDSQALWFTRSAAQEDQPATFIYRWEVQTQRATHLFGDEDSLPLDYSAPILSQDGQWLVIARRPMAGPAGKQLWLYRQDGSQRQAITEAGLASYASPQWDLEGTRLVFQRLALRSSSSTPQVMTWSRQDAQMVEIAADAFQPAWVP